MKQRRNRMYKPVKGITNRMTAMARASKSLTAGVPSGPNEYYHLWNSNLLVGSDLKGRAWCPQSYTVMFDAIAKTGVQVSVALEAIEPSTGQPVMLNNPTPLSSTNRTILRGSLSGTLCAWRASTDTTLTVLRIVFYVGLDSASSSISYTVKTTCKVSLDGSAALVTPAN